jgi:hypothetical protein
LLAGKARTEAGTTGAHKVASGVRASYVEAMPAVKPFRGLRFVPSRVDLGAVVAPAPAGDPRHVSRILEEDPVDGDGRDGPIRRARLRLAEWQRAGVLARDAQPALYAVRRREEDGAESIGLFCALSVAPESRAAEPPAEPAGAREARLEKLAVAVEPVVAAFREPRVQRTLENAIDREADAWWRLGKTQLELWCLDEESTTARLQTLLSQAELEVERGADVLQSHTRFWLSRAESRSLDDDKPRAAAFALAFLHAAEERWAEVPVGAAILPLSGPLE